MAASGNSDPRETLLSRFGGGDPRVGAGLAAVMAATAIVYSHSLGHQFIADDLLEVVFNRRLGDWSFLARSMVNDILWFRNPDNLPQSQYYRPLHDIWLWVNFNLFGLNPFGWHAAGLALHLVVVWLAFRIAIKLADDRWTGLLAAALFALIPIHAEVVVYAAAIAPLIAAAFELGAFDLYLRRTPSNRVPGWISLGLYTGALLSYESAAAFPALIAAHAFFMLPRDTAPADEAESSLVDRMRNALYAAWPYVLAAIAYLGVRYWILGDINGADPLNRHPLTAVEAVLTVPGAIASYAGLLAMPWMAGPEHRLDAVGRVATPGFLIPALGIAVVAGACGLILKRDSHRGLHLFCIAWILLALAPVLDLRGLFAGSLIQDRYLYLPSFGFCLLIADLAVEFASESRRSLHAIQIGAGAVLVVFALIAVHVQRFWRDEVAMFAQCAKENPGAEFCHNRLGVAFAARDEYSEARDEFKQAIDLEPTDILTRYNLALVYERMGDRGAAEKTLAERIKWIPNPSPKDYAELAFSAAAAGDQTAADANLKEAEELSGGAGIASLTRARIELLRGDTKAAEQELVKLLESEPDNEPALAALAEAFAKDKRYEDSLAALRRAASLAPGEPSFHYKIAVMLHNLGRDREARDECESALAVSPDNPDLKALLAAIERGGTQ
ncbi:MAG TPA: tetratricopeptide repeat protein [Candidatus Binataceae bacterium]|nr:tetratricopeptide repeat protein [Candidatus Binataceae bacterium]